MDRTGHIQVLHNVEGHFCVLHSQDIKGGNHKYCAAHFQGSKHRVGKVAGCINNYILVSLFKDFQDFFNIRGADDFPVFRLQRCTENFDPGSLCTNR